MAQKLLPLNDSYAKWATQGTFMPHGQDGATKLGDIEALGGTPTLTEIERYSREYPEKTLTRTDVIQKDMALALTVFSLTPMIRSALFMGSPDSYIEQEAAEGIVKTFTKLVVGRVYGLGYRDVTINSFDDGAAVDPVAFVADTHYRLISETGDFELLAIPAGATKAEVDFDAAKIVSDDEREQFGIMETNGLRGKLTLYGVNDIGEAFHIEYWDVEMRPNGEIAHQGTDEYTQAAFNCRVYADGTKPQRFRYGRVTVIS